MKRNVKEYSQHFLRGKALIYELIGHSNIKKSDTVLDIGAGSGAITEALSSRTKYVIAYELDSDSYRKLNDNLQDVANVKLINSDFLATSLPSISYKVFSNIPFSLSSDIVQKLTIAKNPPTSIYLIVQKQFANKLVIGNDKFNGALGVSIAPWWQAKIRRPLKKYDFTPPPAVDTVLLEIKRKPEFTLNVNQAKAFRDFVFKAFHDNIFYKKITKNSNILPSQLDIVVWIRLFESNK